MQFSPSRILVPYDYSERCDQSVRSALSIVGTKGSVHVAHIIGDYYPEYAAIKYPEITAEKNRILHRRKMSECLSAADIDTSRLTLHCKIGDPGSELARLAGDLNVDLVIIPSHDRRGLKRWLLGSVAERVARLSPCSVLIAKPCEEVQQEVAPS
jgi:nucleotide-binding universal stress UspA family protein